MMDPNHPDPYVDPIEYNPGDTVIPTKPEPEKPDDNEDRVEQPSPAVPSDG